MEQHTPGPYTLPCGCKIITKEYANGEYGVIDFCPLHKAAPELLAQLRKTVVALGSLPNLHDNDRIYTFETYQEAANLLCEINTK